MFGDDPFSGIFEEVFGRTRRPRYTSQNSNNLLNIVEERKKEFLIFDFSGKKITSIKIKDELELNEYEEEVFSGNKILEIKTSEDETLKYKLPKKISKNKISHTFSNGILEVKIEK